MQHEEFHDCGGNLDQTIMGQFILSYKTTYLFKLQN